MDSKTEKRHQQRRVETVFDLIEQGAEDDLLELAQKTEVAYLTEFEDEAKEYIDNAGKYLGVSTGYKGIDRLLGSFVPGELLVIGGDTGHGKSLLAMNIASRVYKREQLPVLLVNLELTNAQAVVRFHNIANGDYAGIMVQRSSSVSYRDISVIMQKAKDEGAVMVIIDHLHFFSRSARDQTLEISRIMKHFKECAVEQNLPVILLSHVTPTRIMSPTGEIKKEYKPSLHNLKGSSSIEQDADMVGFVYRSEGSNTMEFYLRKNRSRDLITESVELKQDGWKLLETEEWSIRESNPFTESSQQKDSASSTTEEVVSLTQSDWLENLKT